MLDNIFQLPHCCSDEQTTACALLINLAALERQCNSGKGSDVDCKSVASNGVWVQ